MAAQCRREMGLNGLRDGSQGASRKCVANKPTWAALIRFSAPPCCQCRSSYRNLRLAAQLIHREARVAARLCPPEPRDHAPLMRPARVWVVQVSQSVASPYTRWRSMSRTRCLIGSGLRGSAMQRAAASCSPSLRSTAPRRASRRRQLDVAPRPRGPLADSTLTGRAVQS